MLFDRLLTEPSLSTINPHDIRKVRAMAYCKAGQFMEAEEELKQLFDVLKSHGASVTNSPVIYWYQVARYRGDEKKALDEFRKM